MQIQMLMFAVFDNKAEAFQMPFFQPTIGLAERNFIDLANNPESTVNAYPADFSLWQLGRWDTATGDFEEVRHLVCSGVSCLRQVHKDAKDGATQHNGTSLQRGAEGRNPTE